MDPDYEDKLKVTISQKRRTRTIWYNQVDLETSQLLKISRRPGLEDHNLEFFYKPGEPVEEGKALHAELLSAETVNHLQ